MKGAWRGRSSSAANLHVDRLVQHHPVIGSPRRAGSTSSSSAGIRPGSVSSQRGRPAPERHTRPDGNGSARESSASRPAVTVFGSTPAARATASIPPWPIVWASASTPRSTAHISMPPTPVVSRSLRAAARRGPQGAESSHKEPRAEPPDHAIGRSRGGLSTKTHQLADGRGRLRSWCSPRHGRRPPRCLRPFTQLAVKRLSPGSSAHQARRGDRRRVQLLTGHPRHAARTRDPNGHPAALRPDRTSSEARTPLGSRRASLPHRQQGPQGHRALVQRPTSSGAESPLAGTSSPRSLEARPRTVTPRRSPRVSRWR